MGLLQPRRLPKWQRHAMAWSSPTLGDLLLKAHGSSCGDVPESTCAWDSMLAWRRGQPAVLAGRSWRSSFRHRLRLLLRLSCTEATTTVGQLRLYPLRKTGQLCVCPHLLGLGLGSSSSANCRQGIDGASQVPRPVPSRRRDVSGFAKSTAKPYSKASNVHCGACCCCCCCTY